MWDTAILNGTITGASDGFRGNIYIKDGKIGAVTSGELIQEAAETIDCAGLDIFPGFIDTHTHCRDGGAPQKDSFYHATRGAAIGGLTMVIEMPNAIPPVSTVENMRAQIKNLSSKAHVDFAMWGLCVGELNNEHIQGLHEAGVVAFKFF
jgi:dihydroorotase/allantoinase